MIRPFSFIDLMHLLRHFHSFPFPVFTLRRLTVTYRVDEKLLKPVPPLFLHFILWIHPLLTFSNLTMGEMNCGRMDWCIYSKRCQFWPLTPLSLVRLSSKNCERVIWVVKGKYIIELLNRIIGPMIDINPFYPTFIHSINSFHPLPPLSLTSNSKNDFL